MSRRPSRAHDGPRLGWQAKPYAFRDAELGKLLVHVDDPLEPGVEVGAFRLPRRFTIEPGDRSLPLLEVETGANGPECTAIRRRPGGPALKTENVRFKVTAYVKAAAYGLALERSGREHKGAPVWQHALGRGVRGEVEAAVFRRPGAPLSDAFLERVAGVYREALAIGQPPTAAVAREIPGSRSSAGRWVQEARRRGFLGRATPRRPGESRPTRRKRQ